MNVQKTKNAGSLSEARQNMNFHLDSSNSFLKQNKTKQNKSHNNSEL